MLSGISGVEVGSPLAHWAAVLENWCTIVDQWCEICSPDRPWWHLEVSNAGLIASAAILCGHAALTESSVPKTRGTGRSDLWIQFAREAPESLGSEGEFIELKISKVRDDLVDGAKMDAALSDAAAIRWPCRRKLGGCLYIAVGSLDQSQVNDMVEKVRQKTRPDAIAWIFPKSVRAEPTKNGIYEPGVLLALKILNEPRD